MREFFKMMFASMAGLFLTLIVLFFLFLAFISAIISFTKPDEVVVEETSILHLNLDYEINDRESSIPFGFNWDFSTFKSRPGLKEVLETIRKAKTDDRIKGIYLEMSDMPSGMATLKEIRDEILDFKSSGKFVFAYGVMYFQKAYYMATAADKIFLNPEGLIELRGFRGEVMFIKGLLDKLGVDAQIIRHGKFKSAVEPLMYDKMSEENREQVSKFIHSMWGLTVDEMTTQRRMDTKEMNRIADLLLAQNPQSAYELGIVDSLIYLDEFLQLMAGKIGEEYIKTNHLITLNKYADARVSKEYTKRSKNKIAVIYAEGDIMQGEGSEDVVGGDQLARTIRQVRLDNSYQAIVLRVNSPGGDGLASEIIYREVLLANQVKPVVVSMGNYAASGGYYIACPARKIVAQPTTITGSIGVFGVIPNFRELFNEKLGITFDGVNTNLNSEYISVTMPLSDYQREMLQAEINRFYKTFVDHVAEARGLTYEEVDAIGQGRVWSGTDALALGLVDTLGGLEDAIRVAAGFASLTDYKTTDLPRKKEPFEQIMEDLFSTKVEVMGNRLGNHIKYLEYIESVSRWSGIQTRMPYAIFIE